MKILAKLVLAVALLAFAHPAHADTFAMDGHAVFYVFSLHPPAGGYPIVEFFNTTFNYDPLSRSVSDMSISASGLLDSNFTFTGVTDDGSRTEFLWSNSQAVLDGEFVDDAFDTARRVGGANSGGTKAILPTCLTAACNNDFGGAFNIDDAISNMSAGPVTTPEPASLLLMGSGILGILGFRKLLA
jgi:PEP-CTERM motif